MILKHKAELAGRVKLQISGGERGTIDYDWFDNMILDRGLALLVDTRQLASNARTNLPFRCYGVGSSSAPVTPTQVGLQSPIALWPIDAGGERPQVSRGFNAAEGFGWSRCTWSFPRGGAAGNISELTASNGYNYTSAIARALVRDSEGNPTTITVLPDEVLSITWEFRRWWSIPEPHLLEYDNGDGVMLSTLVTYQPLSGYGTGPEGLGSAGDGGVPWETVALNTSTYPILFTEGQGNPAISSVGYNTSKSGSLFPAATPFATFNPPIPKTNEFICNITLELSITRRAP